VSRRFALYSPLDPAFVGGLRSWLTDFWVPFMRTRDASLTVLHAATRPHAAHGSMSAVAIPSVIDVVEVPAVSVPGLPGRLASIGALAEALRGFDLVYVDNGYAFQDRIALAVARRAGIATISGHHAVIRFGGLHDLAWAVSGRGAIRRFDAVHVLNADDRAYLSGLGAHNVFDVPIAVDTESFAPRVRPMQFTVAFIGRLHLQKGVDRLAAIVKKCSALAGAPISFVIGGAGPDAGELHDIENLPNVRVLGALDRAACARVFGEAHVALVPSRYETFGIVAAEAMASGCHVIASDISGLRDVVSGAGNLIAAPDDVDAWVEAISSVRQTWSANPLALAAESERARAQALSRYSFDAVADRFDALLAAATSAHDRSRRY
jgi:glycosyltransferase involved in cell wall biosynthesis